MGWKLMFIVIRRKSLLLFLLILSAASILLLGCFKILVPKYINSENTAKDHPEYMILVEIEEKKLYLFADGLCIKRYTISSGMPGMPSPIGSWKIINKSDWGEGFGGRWLGLNVTWGKYGIHGTTQEGSIGRAASHGCIRMFKKDVKELYSMVPIGTPVVILNGPFGPFGTGFRELMPGDRGADVLAVQQRLKKLGYFKGYESGIYEDDLKNAIYRFQEENSLQIKYTITRVDYYAMGFREFE
jgi:hypothetical protein